MKLLLLQQVDVQYCRSKSLRHKQEAEFHRKIDDLKEILLEIRNTTTQQQYFDDETFDFDSKFILEKLCRFRSTLSEFCRHQIHPPKLD